MAVYVLLNLQSAEDMAMEPVNSTMEPVKNSTSTVTTDSTNEGQNNGKCYCPYIW